jgi:CRP/FNR family transcriptional regulator
MRDVCVAGQFGDIGENELRTLVATHRHVRQGCHAYHSGDPFNALYAVRAGSFKSVGVTRNGIEKVTGFHLPGDLLGLDAVGPGRHEYEALAMEDAQICVIPFARLEEFARRVQTLQHWLLQAMSCDISRDHGLMLFLGGMDAQQRLAAFLLSLSRRYAVRGYSPRRFSLRMTRGDIASYLGLTLETVSRLMSRFQRDRLILARQRDVELLEINRLRDLVGE